MLFHVYKSNIFMCNFAAACTNVLCVCVSVFVYIIHGFVHHQNEKHVF